MRISDWSSDVCSSDLFEQAVAVEQAAADFAAIVGLGAGVGHDVQNIGHCLVRTGRNRRHRRRLPAMAGQIAPETLDDLQRRTEERREGYEWGRTCRSRWSPYH